jgi:hypothetical protein
MARAKHTEDEVFELVDSISNQVLMERRRRAAKRSVA